MDQKTDPITNQKTVTFDVHVNQFGYRVVTPSGVNLEIHFDWGISNNNNMTTCEQRLKLFELAIQFDHQHKMVELETKKVELLQRAIAAMATLGDRAKVVDFANDVATKGIEAAK